MNKFSILALALLAITCANAPETCSDTPVKAEQKGCKCGETVINLEVDESCVNKKRVAKTCSNAAPECQTGFYCYDAAFCVPSCPFNVDLREVNTMQYEACMCVETPSGSLQGYDFQGNGERWCKKVGTKIKYMTQVPTPTNVCKTEKEEAGICTCKEHFFPTLTDTQMCDPTTGATVDRCRGEPEDQVVESCYCKTDLQKFGRLEKNEYCVGGIRAMACSATYVTEVQKDCDCDGTGTLMTLAVGEKCVDKEKKKVPKCSAKPVTEEQKDCDCDGTGTLMTLKVGESCVGKKKVAKASGSATNSLFILVALTMALFF